jgi:hypothetical protein
MPHFSHTLGPRRYVFDDLTSLLAKASPKLQPALGYFTRCLGVEPVLWGFQRVLIRDVILIALARNFSALIQSH